MARIVLHAGMGKAGSTSIQGWLRDCGSSLRTDLGVTTLLAEVGRDGGVVVAPHRSGSTNSFTVMGHVLDHPERRGAVLDAFFEGLEAAAEEHGTVVVSSEGFARPIAYGDEDLVARLGAMARRHHVDVAYYVRPQHAALESGWRHWRSDREKRPSEFIARIDRELHHRETLRFVRHAAPELAFHMRPCRRDLLHGGDVVVDFAVELLGLDPTAAMQGYRENRGVPLDVANALTALPAPHPWLRTQDAQVLEAVKGLLADPGPAPSDRSMLAQRVLQQACHNRYEAGNREVIAELGWPTDAWVPAVAEEVGVADFARMDDLWRTDASELELELLQRSVAALIGVRAELAALRSRRAVRGALAASRLLGR